LAPLLDGLQVEAIARHVRVREPEGRLLVGDPLHAAGEDAAPVVDGMDHDPLVGLESLEDPLYDAPVHGAAEERELGLRLPGVAIYRGCAGSRERGESPVAGGEVAGEAEGGGPIGRRAQDGHAEQVRVAVQLGDGDRDELLPVAGHGHGRAPDDCRVDGSDGDVGRDVVDRRLEDPRGGDAAFQPPPEVRLADSDLPEPGACRRADRRLVGVGQRDPDVLAEQVGDRADPLRGSLPDGDHRALMGDGDGVHGQPQLHRPVGVGVVRGEVEVGGGGAIRPELVEQQVRGAVLDLRPHTALGLVPPRDRLEGGPQPSGGEDDEGRPWPAGGPIRRSRSHQGDQREDSRPRAE
jgi:hypothetical protein